MITTSEFLFYVRKTSTKRVYTSALSTYLRVISQASQDKQPLGKIPQPKTTPTTPSPSLDQRWITYLTKIKNPWHDMELFPQKAKEQGLSPKTINLYLEIVQLYLGECNIKAERIQQKRIKKLTPKNYPLTRDIGLDSKTIQNLLTFANTRQRAIILIAASSGMRIGEILRIEYADIDLTKDPVEIYIPAANTKTEMPRITFISKEAAVALSEWMGVRNESITKDNCKKRVFPYTRSYESKKFHEILRKSKNDKRDSVTNRYLIHYHSFRKFFLTEFKLIASAEVAEELAGHAGYLSESYRRLTYQTMKDEYKKAEERLTIFGGDDSKWIDNGSKMLDDGSKRLDNDSKMLDGEEKANSKIGKTVSKGDTISWSVKKDILGIHAELEVIHMEILELCACIGKIAGE